jgi:hypothetical protein
MVKSVGISDFAKLWCQNQLIKHIERKYVFTGSYFFLLEK